MFFNSTNAETGESRAEPVEITLAILKQLNIGDISTIRLLNSAFNALINAENQKLLAERIQSSPYYRNISDEDLFQEGYNATAINKEETDDSSISFKLRIVGKFYFDDDGSSTYIMRCYQIVIDKNGTLSLHKQTDQANGMRDSELNEAALLARLGEQKTLNPAPGNKLS